MLFGNAYVNIVAAQFGAPFRRKPEHARRSRRQHRNFSAFSRIAFADFVQQKVISQIVVIFPAAEVSRLFAALHVKRHAPMPRFLVFFRRLVAFAFQRVKVDNYRFRAVFNLSECRNQRLNVVAVGNVQIIVPQCLKQIGLRFAVALAQLLQVIVKPAVISAIDI